MSYIDNIPNELKISLSSFIERYNIIVEHRSSVTELGNPDDYSESCHIIDVEFVDLIIYNVFYPQYFSITLPIFVTRSPNHTIELMRSLHKFINDVLNGKNTQLISNGFNIVYKFDNGFHQIIIWSNALNMSSCSQHFFRQKHTILKPFIEILDYLSQKIYCNFK